MRRSKLVAVTVLLPDVSQWQSGTDAPDWAGIRAINGGAGIIRAGYGLGYPAYGNPDFMFAANYTVMKKLSYKFIGIYHYLRKGQDALAQAKQFCSWIGPPSAVFPGTVFILDLEEGDGDQSGRANTWHGYVDHFYGLDQVPLSERSWLYSYTSYARDHGLLPIFSSARRTWVAAYSGTEPLSYPHTLWQSTDGITGSNIVNWPGCGKCDTSIYHGSVDQLAALGWQPAPAVPAPVPVTDPLPPLEDDMEISGESKYKNIAFSAGQYSWISFFCDNTVAGQPEQALRIAPWTPGYGGVFTGITSVTVGVGNEKVTVPLPANCAGISVQRGGDPGTWLPVGFNMGG